MGGEWEKPKAKDMEGGGIVGIWEDDTRKGRMKRRGKEKKESERKRR